MAKDLVRTRRYISKFYSMKTQLQAVSLRIQGMRSNQQMAEAMKGATKVRRSSLPALLSYLTDTCCWVRSRRSQAMSLMSRQTNLPQIQRILQQFEQESSMMDMKEEMMGDAIDDAMEGEEGETEEEEGDRILEEVLAEIGVSVGQQVRFSALVSPFGWCTDPIPFSRLPLQLFRSSPRHPFLPSPPLPSPPFLTPLLHPHRQLVDAPSSIPTTSSLSEPGVRRAVAVGESAGPAATASSSSSAGSAAPAAPGGGDGLADLQARLDNLRRD